MKAKDILGILKVAMAGPLSTEEDFKNYYVDCTEARGADPLPGIQAQLDIDDVYPSQKFLLSGHRGSGKSTELNRLVLKEEIKNKYLVVKFSVLTQLDLNNLQYIDLMFEILHQLVKAAEGAGVRISENVIEEISTLVTGTKVEEIIKRKEKGFDAKAGLTLPLLSKLLGSISAEFHKGVITRETIRKEYGFRLTEFLDKSNQLINDIRNKLKKAPLVIVEDLDKVNTEIGRKVFCEHAPQLTQFNCHIIYTCPIFLVFSPDGAVLDSYFNEKTVIPMIKLTTEAGEKALENVVYRRIEKELFEHGVVEELIKKSGGSLRDIFYILKEAAILGRAKGKIDIQTLTAGSRKVRNTLKATLSESGEGDWKIIPKDLFAKLKEIAEGQKDPDQDKELMQLLYTRCVLQYNGNDIWYDVHPLIREILKDRNLI